MSKQLTMSAVLSVLAMAAFALVGPGEAMLPALALPAAPGISAEAGVLPALGQLLPALQ